MTIPGTQDQNLGAPFALSVQSILGIEGGPGSAPSPKVVQNPHKWPLTDSPDPPLPCFRYLWDGQIPPDPPSPGDTPSGLLLPWASRLVPGQGPPAGGLARQLEGKVAKNARNAALPCPSRSSSSPSGGEQDIPCPGKSKAGPFMGKPRGVCWAWLLSWAVRSEGPAGGGCCVCYPCPPPCVNPLHSHPLPPIRRPRLAGEKEFAKASGKATLKPKQV